jgi:folate-binding protein YgfZ
VSGDLAEDAAFAGDYDALRHGAGAVPVPRDVVRVAGPDAASYLQGQVSQDLDGLVPGASVDALLLTPQGRLDALVRVGRIGDDEFTVDVDGGYGDAVAARLARFKLRVKVDIDPLPWRCVALRGPEVAVPFGSGPAGAVFRFSWNGVTGADILGEDPAAPPGVRGCSHVAWETVRVEAGIPAMGSELDERTIAAEADLNDRAVSFTKGCYTGQELVARLDARGNRVARHLRGLVLAGDGRDPGVLLGAAVVAEERDVGVVTSAARSPALDAMVALAYVHRSVVAPSGATLRTAGEGVLLNAEVRDLPLA